MHEKKITVRFFRGRNGKEPVRQWLLSLPRQQRMIIGIDIKTVEFGWPIGLPVCRSLGKGLWEVRSNLDNRIARVLFCVEGGCMWLLHAFIKKQQKTPKQDLTLARNRKEEVSKAIKQEANKQNIKKGI